ncbi:MAG: SDR family oxidoreductase [Gordonia sp. (in: high G+C Gram-positive bacteria)]
MTSYFMTGASGFIGRRVLSRLLASDPSAQVFALVRSQSLPRFATLTAELDGGDRVVAVIGDLTVDGLDLHDETSLGDLDHVIHLGAIYDMTADEESQEAANVEGTVRVAEFAARHGAMLHHVSSMAVAGDYDGVFTENDFDRGQNLPTAYHRTKFAAERAVREASTSSAGVDGSTGAPLRWRIYRPSAVVGDSTTGEMDKIDGPYYFFGQLARLGHLPSFLRLPMPGLGVINMVPVDYVADAIVALLPHRPGESGLVFHLSDPEPLTVTQMFNALAPAFDAPRGFDVLPTALTRPMLAVAGLSPLRSGRDLTAQQLGIPPAMLDLIALPVDFRSGDTTEILRDKGIELPDFAGYAPLLWNYWAEHLDPGRFRKDDPLGPLVGKNIVITGGSSGIGRATARMCIKRGANVILVARDADRLAETVDHLNAEDPKPGLPLGTAVAYPADITDEAVVGTLAKSIIAEHSYVDILVNNAGRSIRRATMDAVDRAHDYHRVMAVNYFGAVHMTLALLPHMVERQSGHVVNVSSIMVQSRGPRFGAYAASKAALETFADVTSTETLSDHVTFSSVRLPLVRTRMIAPTAAYQDQHGIWNVDKAATRVLRAMIDRPRHVNTALGDLAEFGHRVAPRLTNRILHQEFLAVD